MLDRVWDFFVETMMFLFLPLVCFYHTLSADLFLNVSSEKAAGLEQIGNLLLTPCQYLFAGRLAKETEDGTIEFVQRFNYEENFWTHTAYSLAALPPSLIVGSAVKALGLLSEESCKRQARLKAAWQSKTLVKSNLDTYRKWGLAIQDPDQAEFFDCQGHLRGPGSENHLAVDKKALKEIAAVLNGAHITWWVDCGTCLGTYRYGGIIPWDVDIDIAVLAPDFENVRRVLNGLDSAKYQVQDWSSRSQPHSYLKVLIKETNTLIDIYHFEVLPETRQIRYIFSLESHLLFPEWLKVRERRFKPPVALETVFPLRKANFDGVEVFVPSNPEKYLQRYYGENLAPAKIYDPVTGRYEKDLSHPYWQRQFVH